MFKVKRRLRSSKKALNRSKHRQTTTLEEPQPGSLSDASSVAAIRGILKAPGEQQQQQQPQHDSNSVASLASHSRNSARTNDSGTTTEATSAVAAPASERTSPSDCRRRRVGFQAVHVREYVRTLGDNPSCSSGAPVTIGWAHSEERKIHIDEYEAAKKPSRPLPQLILTRQDREEILLKWGATFHEIIEAIRTNVRVKHQRRRTVNAIGTYDRWEEYMEKAGRKIKRTLKLQKQKTPMAAPRNAPQTLDQKIFGSSAPPSPNGSRPAVSLAGVPSATPTTPPARSTLEKYEKNSTEEAKNGRITVRPPPSPQSLEGGSAARNSKLPHVGLAGVQTPVKDTLHIIPAIDENGVNDNNDDDVVNGGEETKQVDMFQENKGVLIEGLPSMSPPDPTAPVVEIDIAGENSMASASEFGGSMDSSCYKHDDCMSIDTKEFLKQVENYKPPVVPRQLRPAYETTGRFVNNQSVHSNESASTVELDDLRRDHSFWEVGGDDGPGIKRKITPVVIYEDADEMPGRRHKEPLDPQVEAYDLEQQRHLQQMQMHQQYLQQQMLLQHMQQQQQQQQVSPPEACGAPPSYLMKAPPGSHDMISRWQ